MRNLINSVVTSILELEGDALDTTKPNKAVALSARSAKLDPRRIIFLNRLRPEHLDALVAENGDDRERSDDDHVIVVALSESASNLSCVIERTSFLLHDRVLAVHLPKRFNLPGMGLVSGHPQDFLHWQYLLFWNVQSKEYYIANICFCLSLFFHQFSHGIFQTAKRHVVHRKNLFNICDSSRIIPLIVVSFSDWVNPNHMIKSSSQLLK